MSVGTSSLPKRRGRPRRADPAEIDAVALDLFSERGFDETTMEDVAAALQIGRRTLFRYFPSKNDIVWGDFDSVLHRLRHQLRVTQDDVTLWGAISNAALESNRYEPEQLPELRIRMTLITTVPALQAHSAVRYAEWRQVIADFAGHRLRQRPVDLLPLTVSYAALGASLSAFTRWVDHPEENLEDNLRASYAAVGAGFGGVA
jgi:TetR/AcrR family transcriptional regulator, regulator of mycofactocin system